MFGRLPTVVAKPVADRVLDPQGREIEALQRALDRGEVDPQRPLDAKSASPRGSRAQPRRRLPRSRTSKSAMRHSTREAMREWKLAA